MRCPERARSHASYEQRVAVILLFCYELLVILPVGSTLSWTRTYRAQASTGALQRSMGDGGTAVYARLG